LYQNFANQSLTLSARQLSCDHYDAWLRIPGGAG
jgi:hypothetical protein